MSLKDASSFTVGQLGALLTLIGGEDAAWKILRGEMAAELVPAEQKAFNRHGIRICPKGVSQTSFPAQDDCQTEVPFMNFSKRLPLLNEALGYETIQPEAFSAWADSLREDLKGDPIHANIMHGVCLPIWMPKIDSSLGYNDALRAIFYPALGKAFPMTPISEGPLRIDQEDLVITTAGNGMPLFERAMRESFAALYFPFALRGFRFRGAREQMGTLPKTFSLPGLAEVVIALILYGDVLEGKYLFAPALQYDIWAPGLELDPSTGVVKTTAPLALDHNPDVTRSAMGLVYMNIS